jgi:hypothetical protein
MYVGTSMATSRIGLGVVAGASGSIQSESGGGGAPSTDGTLSAGLATEGA